MPLVSPGIQAPVLEDKQFFLIFFLFGSSHSTCSGICLGASRFWIGFCDGTGLVDVLVVVSVGISVGVLVGVLGSVL